MDWTLIYVGAGVIANWLILYFWQPWTKGYAEEKGKTFARKEDLDVILAEVRAVTITQKEIESKLSGDLFHQQLLLNQKRDVYVELIKHASELLVGYKAMKALVEANADEETKAKRWGGLESAHSDFARITAIAAIFNNATCVNAVQKFYQTFHEPGGELTLKRLDRYNVAVSTLLGEIIDAARQDFKILESKPTGPHRMVLV